jgi:hypothetical protein
MDAICPTYITDRDHQRHVDADIHGPTGGGQFADYTLCL